MSELVFGEPHHSEPGIRFVLFPSSPNRWARLSAQLVDPAVFVSGVAFRSLIPLVFPDVVPDV